MSPGSGGCHGGIHADHLGAQHRHGFALGGIHLARHDRTARFIGRQQQFPQSCSWAAGQQPDVIGNGEQRHGQTPQLGHGLHQSVMARHHGKQILGRLKFGSRSTGELSTDVMGKSCWCVQTAADGCTAQR